METEPAHGTTGGPASSSASWGPWALGLFFLALGLLVWEPLPPGIWHDDGVYVILGRSLAEGEGLRYVGIVGEPLAPKFPPLFPLVLAAVWMLFPGFPENIPFLAGVNLVITAGAAVAFTFLVRRILKGSLPVATLITGFIWLSAHVWRVAAVPLSEPLFLLTLTLCLLAGLAMEAEPKKRTILWFLVGAGLAVFSRTLGVAALAAGVVTLVLDRRVRAATGVAIGSVVLLLPWIVWTRWAGATIPEPHQDILGSYAGWLMPQMLGAPVEFLQFLMGNAAQLVSRIATLLLPGWTGPVRLLGLLLVPVFLVGAAELYRRGRLVLITLVLGLGILLVWPFQDVRLLVPFQPLLMLILVLGFHALAGRPGLTKPLRIGVFSVGILWAASFIGVSGARWAGGWIQEGYRVRADALLDGVRAVVEGTPETAVVGAPELWAGIHLFTGRTVVPSARFRPLSRNGPPEGTPEEQYAIWLESGLTHVLVEHGGRVHGPAIDRIDATCPPGTVELIDNQPGRYLVALHWDQECQEGVLAGGEGQY